MTEREEELMNLLWAREEAMTSIQFEQSVDEKEWNHAAIFRVIKSLLKKGLIEECGTELHKKQYARRFRPTITKEEYLAGFLAERGIDGKSLAGIAMTLVKKNGNTKKDDELLISELENMISNLRRKKKNGD